MSSSAPRSPNTTAVRGPPGVAIAVAIRRTGAEPIVASRTTVSPTATVANDAASSMAARGSVPGTRTLPASAPPPVGAVLGPPPTAPGGTMPWVPEMTNPTVPDRSPPMTRPGRLGSLVTESTCGASTLTARVAPVSWSMRARSWSIDAASRLRAAAT